MSEEQIVGSLNLGHKRINAYSDEDMKVVHLVASQLSVALKNHKLLEELRKANRELESAKKILRCK